MDSLYFTELVERSENNTQQETGEYLAQMGTGKVLFSKKIVVYTKWVKHDRAYIRVWAHR
jgi:hypothetical protein